MQRTVLISILLLLKSLINILFRFQSFRSGFCLKFLAQTFHFELLFRPFSYVDRLFRFEHQFITLLPNVAICLFAHLLLDPSHSGSEDTLLSPHCANL